MEKYIQYNPTMDVYSGPNKNIYMFKELSSLSLKTVQHWNFTRSHVHLSPQSANLNKPVPENREL